MRCFILNKKKTQIIKIIAVATAVVLTLSTALVFGGCGDKKADTNATVAPTTAATTAVNSNSADGAQNQGNDAQQSGDQSSSQGGDSSSGSHSINEAWYAGISEQAAGQAALQQVGPDARIKFYEAGTYDGQECWIVYVLDESTGASYICYVSGSFVQVEEGDNGHSINDTYYAGISEQMAGQKAIEAFGGDDTSGVRITGYAADHYNGSEAWCVHLINDNTGEEGTVYVSGDFCVVV